MANTVLRTIREFMAAVVLFFGLLWVVSVNLAGDLIWASPHAVWAYDVQPYPATTRLGQLGYAGAIVGGWVLVWLSGFLLVGRWSDRLATPIRLCIILIPVALGFAMWHMNPLPKFPESTKSQFASVRGLGNKVKMQFPAGTELIEARAEHGLDWTVAARLRMPTAAVMPFIKTQLTAPFRNEPYLRPELDICRTGVPDFEFVQTVGMHDWHPEHLRKPVSAAVSGIGQREGCLAADLSETPTSTVYLVFAVY